MRLLMFHCLSQSTMLLWMYFFHQVGERGRLVRFRNDNLQCTKTTQPTKPLRSIIFFSNSSALQVGVQ